MSRLPHRLVMVLIVLGLICGWLSTAVAPAAAVVDWGVRDPGLEALVDGPLDLRVFVEAAEGEQVQAVVVRFLRDGWLFGEGRTLSYRAGPVSGGRSDWGSRLNPNVSWVLRGQAMPNGVYDVQTQAKVLTSAGEQWTEWRGHAIALQVPPPATVSTVRNVEGGRVEVSWQRIQLPDFIRYEVERSADGATWSVITSMTSPDATRTVDVPPPGTWRYRTRVVRSDGQGGQLATASAPAGIDKLPTALRNGSSQPTMVGKASADEASDARALPSPLLPSVRATAPLEAASSRPHVSGVPPPLADTYRRTLPYPKVGRQSTQPQMVTEGGRDLGSSTISVVESPLRDRQLLVPIAGGLLLMMIAARIGLQLRR
jgi:hypothetical protein